MIQSYLANLNSLGNPRIYGSNTESLGIGNTIVNLLYSRFIIERNATGIVIYITPETNLTVDAANTNAANGVSGSNVYGNILSLTGLTIIFQNNRFEITGDLLVDNSTEYNSDSITEGSPLSNMISTLLLKDNSNNLVETQIFALSLNHSNFYVEQQPCSNKLKFTYLDCNYDFQNPLDTYGLAERGSVEYQYQDSFGNWISIGTSKIERGYDFHPPMSSGVNATAQLIYGFCDDLVNTPLRAIRTVRAIPNCGGTSPIIYQSISTYFKNPLSSNTTLFSSIPYIPSATFDGSFACCVSEDSEIEVTPLTLTPNRSTPHNSGIANALKYDLYINNEGVYEEVPILELKTGTITVIDDSTTVVGTGTSFLTQLTVGSKLYTPTNVLIGGAINIVETTVLSIIDDTHLVLSNPALDSYTGTFKSQANYFINPTEGSGGSVFNFPTILPKTGTIVTLSSSDIITGTSTNFTSLNVQDKIYTDVGILIGRISSVISDTQIKLYGNALVTYSGIFKTQSAVTSKGTYKLIATYNNACTSVSKEWIISICNSTIINTGTCNNPSIQNLSSINTAKFTLKTSNSLDIVDSVTQKVILKDQLVDIRSTYQIPKLDDGFYKLDVDTLNSSGVVIGTESQLLFYDCNIKSCEVYLRSNLLGYNGCVDCIDKKASDKEYETLKMKNDTFQIYKDIIYSYWNNIKKQESIDATWDIEDHLQEVTTYSTALSQIKKICTDCGFSFNTASGTLSSSDCGCSK